MLAMHLCIFGGMQTHGNKQFHVVINSNQTQIKQGMQIGTQEYAVGYVIRMIAKVGHDMSSFQYCRHVTTCDRATPSIS